MLGVPIPPNPLAAPPPHWRPGTLERAKAHRTQQCGVDKAAAKIGESWHCRPGQGPHLSHIICLPEPGPRTPYWESAAHLPVSAQEEGHLLQRPS